MLDEAKMKAIQMLIARNDLMKSICAARANANPIGNKNP
jgi:hypothetical protein